MDQVEQVWRCAKLLKKYIEETQKFEFLEDEIDNEKINRNLEMRYNSGAKMNKEIKRLVLQLNDTILE